MKKVVMLATLLLSLISVSNAQYKCFAPYNETHWFVDSIGYLRGIKLDSIRIEGADTVYYPFYSIRIPAVSTGPLSPSWVCSAVHEKPDGTWLFNNVAGDTIVIKTEASVGDTWTFYNDTGVRYYEATVAGMDTMTINGVVDSIKRFVIQAYPDCWVSGFTFAISKQHGFVRIFDLYNFPGAYVGTASDVYFSDIGGNQQFDHIDFRPPSKLQMYDYHPGDVFEYHTKTDCYCPTFGGPEEYTQDSVVYRDDPDPYHAIVVMQHIPFSRYVYCPDPGATSLQFGTITYDTLRLDTTRAYAIDTLPEVAGQRKSYYYERNDTTYGYQSPLHHRMLSSIFEECGGEDTSRKEGLGFVLTYHCSTCGFGDPVWNTVSTELIYFMKDGVGYGYRYPLAVEESIQAQHPLNIYPNPASETITIDIKDNTLAGELILLNNVGKIMGKEYVNSSKKINVKDLPEGLYYIVLTTNSGRQITNKILILHP